MATETDENQRLMILLAKDLYKRGCEAAREGSRFAHGVAVSHFHDAAEIAARAAALKIGAPVRAEANFQEYWKEVNDWAEKQQLSTRLLHRAEMGDLNEARKSFKHRGKLLQPEYVLGFQAVTRTFLADTFRDFFSIDFESISGVTFVRELRVKEQLEAAQAALATANVTVALERCAEAWAVTSAQQQTFFPTDRDPGIPVAYDKQLQTILSATRGQFATVFDHLYQLGRLTFAALLGFNAADLFLLIQTLPVPQGDRYAYPTRPETVAPETVAHIIELIADYSSALLRQVEGFTQPAWLTGAATYGH